MPVLSHELGEAIDTVLVVFAASLGQAVGVEEERVAGVELQLRCGRICFLEQAEWDARRLEQQDVVAVCGDDGWMSCVVDFNVTVWLRLAAYDRYVVSGQDLFADGSIDVGDDQIQRNAHGEKVAKECVNLRHEQRRGDAFAGDVAEEEVERAVVLDEITVVATDCAKGSVVVVRVPAAGAELVWRQELAL